MLSLGQKKVVMKEVFKEILDAFPPKTRYWILGALIAFVTLCMWATVSTCAYRKTSSEVNLYGQSLP